MLANQQVQVLNYLCQEDDEIQKVFSPLRLHIESVINNSLNRSTEDPLTDSNNGLMKILQSLAHLGKKAEEDLQNIERYRQDVCQTESANNHCEVKQESYPDEQEELGITGTLLKQENGVQHYVPEDLFGFKKESLPEDDSLKNVYLLLGQCKDLLMNLRHPGEEKLRLQKLLSLADEMMIHLRRYRALLSVSLTLSQSAEKEDKLNEDLHMLFKRIFHLISQVDSHERENLYNGLSGAWVWETGPGSCEMVNSTVKKLSLRVYGVEQVDVGKSEVFVVQDKEHQPLNKKLSNVQISKDENKGIFLEISNYCFKDLPAARKRGIESKLYRCACSIVVSLPESRLQFQCFSLPFIIRTGSPQLWPYISNIVWFIWAQKDMRDSDLSCPKELELNSVLGLIQARIVGAGLRLRNRALWSKMKSAEESTTVSAQEGELPHKLTDGERRGWIDIIKEKCGIDPKKLLVSRQNFKKLTNDCCLWTLVCAAVNTGLHLKHYNLDKFFHIGLDNRMCKSLRNVGPGDFFLRCSLTRLSQQTGKEPLAKIVIQVCATEEVRPVVRQVEEFERWTLKTLIDSTVWPKLGDTPVRYILPDRDNVLSIEEDHRNVFHGTLLNCVL